MYANKYQRDTTFLSETEQKKIHLKIAVVQVEERE